MNERWVKIKKKYWPPRKDQLLILILVGLLLAVISVPVEDNREPEEVQVMDAAAETEQWEADYESRMEQRLEELLGNVEGVGQVRVMLTFQGTGEKIVEKDRSSGSEESREETVYEERGSSERAPYVTSETNPKVDGVLVIAEGGGNSHIRQEILEAAQALFGVDAHKIKIMKMEGTK